MRRLHGNTVDDDDEAKILRRQMFQLKNAVTTQLSVRRKRGAERDVSLLRGALEEKYPDHQSPRPGQLLQPDLRQVMS